MGHYHKESCMDHGGCCHGGDCGSYQHKMEMPKGCETGSEAGDMMTAMADKAWEALFMDKAKDHWEKLHGKQMDKMVEASVKTSMAYHMNMMKGKQEVAEAAKKIHEAMSG